MKHQKAPLDALRRYQKKEVGELFAIRLIYEKVAREFPLRFAKVSAENRLSVKEHLNLINQALVGKNPQSISINCKPAIMAGKGAK